MKFTIIFLLTVASLVFTASGTAIAFGETLGNSTDLNSTDLKPTSRFQSWTKTGSGLSTVITVVSTANGRSSTTTMRAAGTLTELKNQLLSLLTRCVLTYQQRCDLLDVIEFMISRARNSNLRANFQTFHDAMDADKLNLFIDNVVVGQALQNIDFQLGIGNLAQIAALAHDNMVAGGHGGHCTYNYRECKATGKSFGHRKHHCYWAIFRCTQDMEGNNLEVIQWCGWLMQASMYNMMTLA